MEKAAPKSTMIGAVLSEGPGCHPIIVESGGFSLFQHNSFLWEVDVERAEFVEADGFTASSRYFDSTLDAWMDEYSLAERARFVDALFDVIRVMGAKRFPDIMADRKTNVSLMLGSVEKLDPELQRFIKDVIRSFAKTATVEKAAGAASGIAGTIKKARPSVVLAVTSLKNRGETAE